jgi:hypothetical protein
MFFFQEHSAIPRVDNVLLARLEGQLVDLALARKTKQATTRDARVAPVSQALSNGQYSVDKSRIDEWKRQRTILGLIWGLTLRVWPVHANRAFLCVIIQSKRPSRCITEKVVIGDLVDINAV